MHSDFTWKLMTELYLSCSALDIENDFERAESQLHDIVDQTGLSTAQKKRLRTDVIKAGLHGFGQISRAGECAHIIIQLYIKENGCGITSQLIPGNQNVDITMKDQKSQSGTLANPPKECGWGYFLIERIMGLPGREPPAASYMIEIFLYREGYQQTPPT